MRAEVDTKVVCEDIRDTRADCVVQKHAIGLTGAGKAVGEAIGFGEDKHDGKRLPAVGDWRVFDGYGIGAKRAMFGGVKRIPHFDYPDIRRFARQSLEEAAGRNWSAEHVAYTIHGPGYGLDEREAFESQLAGLTEAIKRGNAPDELERVTIVEQDRQRAERLRAIRNSFVGGTVIEREAAQTEEERSTGYDSGEKPKIFVAMPFDDEHDDVYYSGINQAVEDLEDETDTDILCERVDEAAFTGSITEELKEQIESASLVIADLTGANPNVYLEVGYAWAADVPTLLLAQDTDEDLEFDVSNQKTIVYDRKKLFEMRKDLVGTLAGLDHIETG